MKATYLEPKNKKLVAEFEEEVDVLLLEKGNLVRLRPSRLVLDVILVSGRVRAVDSIVSGCDEVQSFEKGDRLRSGSVVV